MNTYITGYQIIGIYTVALLIIAAISLATGGSHATIPDCATGGNVRICTSGG